MVGFLFLLLFGWLIFQQFQIATLTRRFDDTQQPSFLPKEHVAPPQPTPTPSVNSTSVQTAHSTIGTTEAGRPFGMPQTERQDTTLRPPQPTQVQRAVPPVPATPNPFIEWWKENTLIKIGSLIFFLGAVWFVSYAIAQGWINETLRIVLGIALGVSILTLGYWRRRHETQQYLTLTTLGAGIIIATVYIGQLLFAVFDPLMALLLLLATITYTVYVSVHENQEWLGTGAAIAALVAPLLTGLETNQADLFFVYLAFVSVSFIALTQFYTWRSIPFTLVIGVSLYQMLYYTNEAITNTTLWWFVLFFTALFFAAATRNLTKDNRSFPIDITLLGVIAVNFVSWIHVLTTQKSLIAFTAAFIVAGVGYTLYLQQRPRSVVTLYAGLASLLVLLGTSFTFDGYTLAIAFTVEVAVALIVASYLRFSNKVLSSITGFYLLPLLTALTAYNQSDWYDGILHPTGYTLYTLTIASFIVSSWFIARHKQLTHIHSGILAGLFAVITYSCYLITTSNVASALITDVDTTAVVMYLLWLLASYVLLSSSQLLQLSQAWNKAALCSFILPGLAALSSFETNAWDNSALHPHALGSYLMFASTTILALFAAWQYKTRGHQLWLFSSLIYLSYWWFFGVMLSGHVWIALLSGAMSTVVTYVSWLLLSVMLSLTIHQFRYPSVTWTVSQGVFLLPLVTALSSLEYTTWTNGFIDINAVGLYVVTTLLFLIGISYRNEYHTAPNTFPHLRTGSKLFLALAGLYSFATVWVVSQASFANDSIAVAIALFIYTVAGLACYLIAAATQQRVFKIASALLLTAVILRLILIDVWIMELLWRIVTFMGVGALFIATALLEKPSSRTATDNPLNHTP